MPTSGVLRVHFTAEDLARVRLADSVDPMWEIVLSLHLLQNRDLPPEFGFGQWRRTVIERVRRDELGETLSFLHAINPAAYYFPDFLTPTTGEGNVASGIDAIRSTPRSEFRSQLARLTDTGTRPALRQLSDGEPSAIDFLCRGLLAYYQVAVAPYLPSIGRQIMQARDSQCRQLTSGGVEAMLDSTSPFRWQYPILEADFPQDFDLHLDGRGLLLIPAFFCIDHPVKLFDPDLQPTLVFPVAHNPAWLARGDTTGGRPGSLARLISAPRSSVLELIGSRRSISSATIAQTLHMSDSAVSYHTKILREHGLIDSDRVGSQLIHRITPLGVALLLGNTPPTL